MRFLKNKKIFSIIAGLLVPVVIAGISSAAPDISKYISYNTSGTVSKAVEEYSDNKGLLEKISDTEDVSAKSTLSKLEDEVFIDNPGKLQKTSKAKGNKKNDGLSNKEIKKLEDDFVVVNDNIPYFSKKDINKAKAGKVWEKYSELDNLGRCSVAYANICKEIMPTEERGEIGQVKPSGWHTVKYPGIIEGNYLYNRCHLIAYCLAGENANEKNLITGTRYFNVEEMWKYEDMVLDYMTKNPKNHVLYRVTPVFIDDELVARGVYMEGYSVEDNGVGVCFNVFVNNHQPGISIDYKTGESSQN